MYYHTSSVSSFIFILLLISIHTIIASDTQCVLNSLSPSIGPILGTSNVTINIICDNSNSTMVESLLADVMIVFGPTLTAIQSVVYDGYITSHGAMPQLFGVEV